MKKKHKKQVKNINKGNEKLLLSDISIMRRKICEHSETIVGHYYTECPKCGFLHIEVCSNIEDDSH